MKDNTAVNDNAKVTADEVPVEKSEELAPKEQEEVVGGAVDIFLNLDGIHGEG